MERARARAMALGVAPGRPDRAVPETGSLHGRRRLDPVHGDAGQALSQDAVRGDGCPRPAFQRPRPQRIPRHPDREESVSLHRRHPRRPRGARVNDNEDVKAQHDRRILYAFLIGTLVVGLAASVFTEPNIAGWYAGLKKPGFNPPNFIFAPVWTALYVAMAVAAWRAWRGEGMRALSRTLCLL